MSWFSSHFLLLACCSVGERQKISVGEEKASSNSILKGIWGFFLQFFVVFFTKKMRERMLSFTAINDRLS